MRRIVLGIGIVCAIGAAPTPAEDLARQQGTWSVLSFRRDGRDTREEITRSIVRVVEGDQVVWKRDGKPFAWTKIELDPARSPSWIDIIPEDGPSRNRRILGIYRFDGEILTICVADAEFPRPTEFKSEMKSKYTLMRFQKKKAAS